MTLALNTQAPLNRMPGSNPALPSPSIHTLPHVLIQTILNFLSFKETHQMNSVQRSWETLTRNDGHLSLEENNKISDSVLERIIKKHNKLKIVSMNLRDCTKITISGFDYLSKLSSLTRLNLTLITRINEKFASLSKLESLTQLNLGGCGGIADKDLEFLSPLVQLRDLNLNFCFQITDLGLKHLFKLPLTSLGLLQADITDSGLLSLSTFSLTSLDIGNGKVTNLGLSYLSKHPLTRLNIHKCGIITDLGSLSKLPLTNLRFSGCQFVCQNLDSLSALPLRQLSFAACEIDDEQICSLPKLSLTSLDLAYSSSNLSDRSLTVLSNLPLTHLNLTRAYKMSDSTLTHLLKAPLKSLILSQCRNLTDASLDSLIQFPLSHLNLDGCTGISKHLEGIYNLPNIRYYFHRSEFFGKNIPVSESSLKTPEQIHQLIVDYVIN